MDFSNPSTDIILSVVNGVPMPRSDRLFDLIQALRDGRLHRASDLATRLDVTPRTIWRDMATLIASGMPVEGARGMGYILRAPITLPQMLLSATELDALRHGLRHMSRHEDANLARAARTLAGKIASVTPAPAGADPDDPFLVPGREAVRAAPHLPLLRRAIRDRLRLSLTYLDTATQETHTDIRPLRLSLGGKTWSLIVWCEGRGAFRSLRVDRILALTDTGEAVPDEPGRRLADYSTRPPEP
jgi:predicted DNA-binding transcriptional regulator YafY